MRNNSNRILDEPDKYDGSKNAKERLCFLFMVAKQNLKDFVDDGNTYKEYVCNSLNKKLKEFNGDIYGYNLYYNKVFRQQEYSNVFYLIVKLFNALTSFDALNQFVSYKTKEDRNIYSQQRKELNGFVNILNSRQQMKIWGSTRNISIKTFIKDCRDFFIHKGKIICKFMTIPNDDQTKNVPAIAIPLESIWQKEYLEKKNIPIGYGIDAIDMFEYVLEKFDQLQVELDKIVLS